MKRIVTLVSLAVLGFAVVGCASSKGEAKKGGAVSITFIAQGAANPHVITVSGKTTLRDVKPGTLIHCKDGLTLKIPAPDRGGDFAASGYAVGKGVDTAISGTKQSVQVTGSPNGTVAVTCTRK